MGEQGTYPFVVEEPFTSTHYDFDSMPESDHLIVFVHGF
jgi:hypothetical protein